MDLGPPVVIDNGSGIIKAGYAHEQTPRAVMPCVVGSPRQMGGGAYGMLGPPGATKKKADISYFGDEAQKKRAILHLCYPMSHGTVEHWDEIEALWKHMFVDELKANPREQPVLITEVFGNLKSNREKIGEILFEKFKVPKAAIANPAVLSLYAFGKLTGCVVDSGDGVTQVAPIQDGFAIGDAIERLDLGGHDIAEYLMSLLRIKIEESRNIVKEFCYVSADYENEKFNANLRKDFEMPDGQIVNIDNEQITAPEILFQPRFMGSHSPGMHTLTHTAITNCDKRLQDKMFANVLLAGGTTLLKGMDVRLRTELKSLDNYKHNVTVAAPPNREYAAWLGGAIIASLKSFNGLWITKDEYYESGPGIFKKNII